MIKRDRLHRRWRRWLRDLIVLDILFIGVLMSIAHDRWRTGEGPAYWTIAAILPALGAVNFLYYWVSRWIRDVVDRWYGED
jgi:hypothetical protein